MLVAMEDMVAERERAGAIDNLLSVDTGIEKGERHAGLNRRTRRVKALHRLIEQWQVVISR